MAAISTISRLVREARLRAGLTQRELANRAGTAQSVVARVEGGQVVPATDTLERLVRAAGYEVDWRLAPQTRADPLIAAYKRDVDRTLVRENLKKSPEERVRSAQALLDFAKAVRRAAPRDKSRLPAKRRKK